MLKIRPKIKTQRKQKEKREKYDREKETLSGMIMNCLNHLNISCCCLSFLADTFTCPILGTLVPLIWISGSIS